MLILISCAKLMRDISASSMIAQSYDQDYTIPQFMDHTHTIAEQVSQHTTESLATHLKVNSQIAQQTFENYQHLGKGELEQLPALFYYNGIVFKNINPDELPYSTILYAQQHLRITSFLYGLLRPLDLIEPYRLEGKFPINSDHSKTAFDYWKPILTETLIEDTKAAGGILCNLASGEMKNLFDWKLIQREVQVITPEFLVESNGKLKNTVVYTKIARGKMSKYILDNQLTTPEELKDFETLGEYTLLDSNNKSIRFIKK